MLLLGFEMEETGVGWRRVRRGVWRVLRAGVGVAAGLRRGRREGRGSQSSLERRRKRRPLRWRRRRTP